MHDAEDGGGLRLTLTAQPELDWSAQERLTGAELL
jgi:hypothetical protein